jgi:hypothetical protein
VEKIVFHKCNNVDNNAITYLPLLKNSLKHLQISSCGDVTAKGLQPIKELRLKFNYIVKKSNTKMKKIVASWRRCFCTICQKLPTRMKCCKIFKLHFPNAKSSSHTRWPLSKLRPRKIKVLKVFLSLFC